MQCKVSNVICLKELHDYFLMKKVCSKTNVGKTEFITAEGCIYLFSQLIQSLHIQLFHAHFMPRALLGAGEEVVSPCGHVAGYMDP